MIRKMFWLLWPHECQSGEWHFWYILKFPGPKLGAMGWGWCTKCGRMMRTPIQ
jgi:hypothetical protein